jgi:pilus assembly protein Flp/PilA
MQRFNLKEFLREEEGATAIEYAILAAMVAVVIIGFMDQISGGITTIFTSIGNALN